MHNQVLELFNKNSILDDVQIELVFNPVCRSRNLYLYTVTPSTLGGSNYSERRHCRIVEVDCCCYRGRAQHTNDHGRPTSVKEVLPDSKWNFGSYLECAM